MVAAKEPSRVKMSLSGLVANDGKCQRDDDGHFGLPPGKERVHEAAISARFLYSWRNLGGLSRSEF